MMLIFKILLPVLVLSSLAANAADFDCSAPGTIQWEELSPGVKWAQYDLRFTPYLKDQHQWETKLSRSVTVRAFKVDLAQNQFVFHRPSQNLACSTEKNERYIQKMIADSGASVIGAVNANFFVMPDKDILGLALDEKRLWKNNLDTLTGTSVGVFGIENGVSTLSTRDEFIQRHGPQPTSDQLKNYTFAIQAYPRLVNGNLIDVSDGVKNQKVSRTAIGQSAGTGEVILTTIDAAGYNAGVGMTLYEFAHLLKTSKCGVGQSIALNLDGGGSTAFAIPSKGKYLQVDRCRHLGNILTIQKR